MATNPYVKTVWVNDESPSIDDTHLNHIEQGIYDATAGLIQAEADLALHTTNIATLSDDLDTAEGNITTLGNDLDTAEGNITTLQGQVGNHTIARDVLANEYTNAQIDGLVSAVLPSTGTAGQVLAKTSTGTEWADPSGGTSDLMIHVNFVPGTGYTVDHTYAEAAQNISDGGTPIVEYRYNSGQPTYYTLRSYNDTLMIFGYPAIGNIPLVYLYASGGVAYGSARYDATSTVTVAASSWTNGQAVLSVSGITTASTVILGYPVDTTATDYEIMRAADIRVIGQAAGSITIEALGTVPTSDLTFQITRW